MKVVIDLTWKERIEIFFAGKMTVELFDSEGPIPDDAEVNFKRETDDQWEQVSH